MKNKKNIALVLSIAGFFAYVILCYKPLSTELQLTPAWSIEISESTREVDTNLSVLPFKLGQNAGYFTHEGQVTLLRNFGYKASISRNYFTTYSQNSSSFEVFDPKGTSIAKIDGSGFPYLTDNKIFLLLPGGSGFEVKNLNGSTKCRYENTSPITALNAGKKSAIAGFANGVLYTFDENMNLKYTLSPGGSDTEVILGANVSPEGTYFACISGQNKQRFVLYKNENNHAKVVFHKYFKKNIVHQSFLYFNNDESNVYFNDADGLGIINCENFEETHINIPGVILDIQESPVANSLFVLSKEKDSRRAYYTITVIEGKRYKTGSFSFEADSAFILTDENSLFIGKDNLISKLSISKE